MGKVAEPILDRGEYLPDDLICPILSEWLESRPVEQGWIIDGFPRSIPQAEYLEKWLRNEQLVLDAAISLKVPFETLLKRIADRVECPDCRWTGRSKNLSKTGTCPKCGGDSGPRADDGVENFRQRHSEFSSLTLPLDKFYAERGLLRSVDASGPVEEITALVLQKLQIK